MKRWHKIAITIIAVLAITVGAIRLVAQSELLRMGYPDNVPRPPLSYRIK